jgi:hypothetical protein
MSQPQHDLDLARVADLRQRFDASFASPPATTAAQISRITVRASGLVLSAPHPQLAQVARGLEVTPWPLPRPGLLGIASVRGATPLRFAVWDLAWIARHLDPSAALVPPSTPPEWVMVAKTAHGLLGLAFDALVDTRERATELELDRIGALIATTLGLVAALPGL